MKLYEIDKLRLIGSGGFAQVYSGVYKGNLVAVKLLVYSSGFTKDALDEFSKEATVCAKLRSPYLVNFVGVCNQRDCLFLALELMEGGDLHDLLHRGAQLPMREKLRMAEEIAKGLQFLHNNKVLHCDLKTRNVLLDKDNHCKISDFGLCIAKRESSNLSKSVTHAAGTLPYMAPELLSTTPRPHFSPKSDIYSLGMIFWEIGTQRKPYDSQHNDDAVQFCVLKGQREDVPNNIDVRYQDLVRGCWRQQPDSRFSLDEILAILQELEASPESPVTTIEIGSLDNHTRIHTTRWPTR